jgi:hypothetical protein
MTQPSHEPQAPIQQLSDGEFDAIIAEVINKEAVQDAIDATVKPKGLTARPAAAGPESQPERLAWEERVFGRTLRDMTIGDLVKGLDAESPETRRASIEALKIESKAELAALEPVLRRFLKDDDQWVRDGAQDCLDKAEVEVIQVPKKA